MSTAPIDKVVTPQGKAATTVKAHFNPKAEAATKLVVQEETPQDDRFRRLFEARTKLQEPIRETTVVLDWAPIPNEAEPVDPNYIFAIATSEAFDTPFAT